LLYRVILGEIRTVLKNLQLHSPALRLPHKWYRLQIREEFETPKYIVLKYTYDVSASGTLFIS